MVIKGNIVGAIQELMIFIQKYDNRQLDIEYYREFNTESMYRLGRYGVMFIDESYKDMLVEQYKSLKLIYDETVNAAITCMGNIVEVAKDAVKTII